MRRRLRSVIWKQWKRSKVRYVRLRQRNIGHDLAAQTAGSPMGPGAWPTARLCSPHFRLLTSIRAVSLGCWTYSNSTELNRRMRTRLYGGVAGCVKKTRKRHAVRKMKAGPSEPPCRGRLQTAVSCFRQKLRW
jgi:hypothetical protein